MCSLKSNVGTPLALALPQSSFGPSAPGWGTGLRREGPRDGPPGGSGATARGPPGLSPAGRGPAAGHGAGRWGATLGGHPRGAPAALLGGTTAFNV